jgi:NAD(P)H dehydrogenase (quinone)
LVVIYPTWYYGVPAMLKGWLERVWLPGVTFEIATGKQRRPRTKLQHIKLLAGITTSGSPWWWIRLIRDPGRSMLDARSATYVHCALQSGLAAA